MKKFITILLMMLMTSSSFNLFGQKSLRKLRKAKTVSTSTGQRTEPISTNNKSSNVAGKNTEVEISQAFSDGNGVLLKWQTSDESNLIGFNIYRYDGRENVRLNQHLILSNSLTKGVNSANNSEYSFFDKKGVYQNTYSVESVFSNNQKINSRSVYPSYVSELNYSSNSLASDQSGLSAESQTGIVENSKLGSASKTAYKYQNAQSISDPINQKFIESQPGVKIIIKKEGFYRVTKTELQNAGFDVNAPTENWQLYKNGEEQAIRIDPNGQYLEFYSREADDALESDYQPYYLIAGSAAGKRMSSRAVRPVGGTLPATNFYNLQTTKQKLYYIYNIRNGDDQNFFGAIISNTPVSVNFNVTGIDYKIRKTDIYVKIQGLSQTPHLVNISVNGNEMGDVSGMNHDNMSLYFTIPTQYLNEGTNTLQLSTSAASNDYALFDNVAVDLQRKYQAHQDQLSFYTNNFQAADIKGFSNSTIRVFDVTDDGNTKVLTGMNLSSENGLYTVNIPAYQTRKLFALTDSALKQADSIVPNNPSTLANSAHNGKLLVITHKNWKTEANTWAAYRQMDGFTVEVVDVEDIYDTFNYGKLSAKSITDFVQYAKTNWQTPPEYVLLLGDSTYDPRNYIGGGVFNFVPTRLVDTIYQESGSDDALTDFNNDGLAEIPIGRITARTAAEVTQAYNKVVTFEQSLGQSIDRGTLCVSDLPNGYDFAALCGRVMNELPQNFNKSFINRGDVNAPTTLLDSLNNGKFFVNYSGHGNTTIWADSGFFSSTKAFGMTNGNNLSVFTMLTCLNGYFIEINTASLGEQLLKAPNGGAVASWSSSTLTTPVFQELMAQRFYNQLGVGNINRLGDLVNDSKSTIIGGGHDVLLSWVLLGDPTLKVR